MASAYNTLVDQIFESVIGFMAIDPLRTRNLTAECANEGGPLEAIRNFTYQFRSGSFYHLSGPEFGGKRLLLQILGLLCPPDSGEIIVDGRLVTHLEIDDLGEIRNRKYGFLFSSPFLLPAFTVLENVAMPLFKIAQVGASEAKVITEEILEIVGVSRIATTAVGTVGRARRDVSCVGQGAGSSSPRFDCRTASGTTCGRGRQNCCCRLSVRAVSDLDWR